MLTVVSVKINALRYPVWASLARDYCYELGWFEHHKLKRERSMVTSGFYSQIREVQGFRLSTRSA
jgi:hypothetical protein